MTVYAGYPKTLAAVTVAQQTLADLKQRGIPAASPQPDLESRRQTESNEVRYRRGLKALNQISNIDIFLASRDIGGYKVCVAFAIDALF
jgi:4-carboxymuconolactone decarboxylase